MPVAFACLSMVLQSLCDFISPSGTLLDLQLSSAVYVPVAFACLSMVLQSLCDFISPSGTLLDLSDWAFLSSGKGVLRYSVPKWLTYP